MWELEVGGARVTSVTRAATSLASAPFLLAKALQRNNQCKMPKESPWHKGATSSVSKPACSGAPAPPAPVISLLGLMKRDTDRLARACAANSAGGGFFFYSASVYTPALPKICNCFDEFVYWAHYSNWRIQVNRTANIFLLLVTGLTMTGCFSLDMRVQVQPDGQGKVIEKIAIQKAFLEQMQTMMEGFGQQMGAEKSSKIEPGRMFSEKQAKERAAALGAGVQWISSKRISTTDQEGMESVYHFADVNQLKLGTPSPALPGAPPVSSEGPISMGNLRLEKMPGGRSKLTILPSEKMLNKLSEAKSAPSSDDSKAAHTPTPEEMEQARKFFGGMRFAVSVELLGKILTPDVPCLAGNRIILLEMDMDKLLATAGNSSLLSSLNLADPASFQKLLQQAGGIEGMKFCLAPNLQVEFAAP